MNGRFWRAFLVVGLVLGGFAYGCGRTSLDDGFGPSDAASSAGTTGSGGQAGAGVGGRTGGGLGGIMAGSIVPCGTTACVAGKQSCCNRLVNNQLVLGCVSSTDATQCSDGLVSCAADITCTTRLPKCCLFQAPAVAFCLPAGVPCTSPGP